MSNSISLDLVALALKQHKLPPADVRSILESLNAKAAEVEAAKEPKAPKSKKQFVVVISDPEGKLKNDFVAWVVQLGESESPFSVVDRVNLTAHDFNASKKGRLIPVRTHGDAFEVIPARFWREHDLAIKTKLPVAVVKTDNKLSEAPSV